MLNRRLFCTLQRPCGTIGSGDGGSGGADETTKLPLSVGDRTTTATTIPTADQGHIFGNKSREARTGAPSDVVITDEPWRPENRGALVPKGDRDVGSSLANKLLYAATHTDNAQRRHIANLIAKERLYRKLFCGQPESPRIVDDNLNVSLVNGDLSFIKFKDETRELTLETLCEHIQTLIEHGYSLTYIFAYLSYLRRKYRGSYPKLRGQAPAFYRTLIDNYEKERKLKRRIGTDEVYTCEERVYQQMYILAHNTFFENVWTTSDVVPAGWPTTTSTTTARSTCSRLTTLFATTSPSFNPSEEQRSNLVVFLYVFMFMFNTGKRLSEIALLGVEQLRTLLQFEALVIRIPKAKKLGRITMRGYDDTTKTRFRSFLRHSVMMFDERGPFAKALPFDQFQKRRSLDRNFAALYRQAVTHLDEATHLDSSCKEKPRGLSLHSLRRFVAASMFAQGREIDHIRECLDHSSTKVTNMYINKHLMRTYRTTKPPANGASSEHGNKQK